MPKASNFSRDKKQKKEASTSYIGWAFFFVVTLIFFFWKVWPLFSVWNTQKNALAEYVELIPEIEQGIEEKDKKLLEKENEYKKLAAPYQIRETQIYPEDIDVRKMSKILELYSLQMSVAENFAFEINQLSFGTSSPVSGKPYSKMSVDINFTSNLKSLKDFIHFLQTGEFSRKFESLKDSGQLDPRAYNFLKENLFPIAQIQAVNITGEDVDGIPGKIEASLQFYIFSRTAKSTE